MNIFVKIKNNIEYAKYRKLRNKAFAMMKKHAHDKDYTQWLMWGQLWLEATNKCAGIPIK